jgi:hypothetical protein
MMKVSIRKAVADCVLPGGLGTAITFMEQKDLRNHRLLILGLARPLP